MELVLDPMHSDSSARMIVEVTPRWRYIMRERGADWSTRALGDRFLGHWVKVRGGCCLTPPSISGSQKIQPGTARSGEQPLGRFIRSLQLN
jgi:hypothetical protein